MRVGSGGGPTPRKVVRRPTAPSASQVNAATNPQPVRTKPVPPAGPSPQQVRQARAQRQQIVSSERSVAKQAQQQRQAAAQRRRVRVAKANRAQIVSSENAVGTRAKQLDTANKLQPTPGPHSYLWTVLHTHNPNLNDPKIKDLIRRGEVAPTLHAGYLLTGKNHIASYQAPALAVLKQTARGYHATAGAADELVKGHGLGAAAHGFKEGALHLKHAKSWSDVFRDAGVKSKFIRSVGGAAGDLFFDPSTYATFGRGVPAELAAKQAAKKVAEEGAAKDAARGLVVKVGGKEVPGVRRATAEASRPVRAAARKAVPERVRHSVRAKAADANPDIAPVGATREATRAVNQATRAARAKASHGVHMGQQIGLGIRKKIGEKNYQRVIDAIEANDLQSLPADLRQYASHIHGKLKDIHQREKAAGIKQGEITDRPQVAVPKVTAAPQDTAKALSKAKRSVYAAERGLERAKGRAGVHQGRAEVLSRNVSGVRAERAASRVKEPRYAGGGQGVRETQLALQNARHQLTKARAAHEAAITTHESEKALAAAQRQARDEAIKVNEKRALAAKGYIPHAPEPHILEAKGKIGGGRGAVGSGRKTPRPPSSMARHETRPLAELRKEMPGHYSENLAQLVADRVAKGETGIAQANLNKELAAAGREFKVGTAYDSSREAIFHIVGKDIKEIKGHTEASKMAAEGHEGKLFVLNRKLAERAFKESSPHLAEHGIVHGYDVLQAGFKRTATFTPGFHIRNIIGDMQNAYEGQAAYKMPANVVRAGRGLKAYGRQERELKNLTPERVGKATLKTKLYGKVTYDEVAKNLRNEGAFRSGYIAQELPELEHAGMQTEAKLKTVRMPEKAKRAALAREDLARLTTAMQALREGATYREAAQRVADYHFDYQHLTQFERDVMRRALPFYTWSARNIPLQAKMLVSRPGKFAHIQAIREEAQKATGAGQQDQQVVGLYKQLKAAGVKLTPGWEKFISQYEQRNAGIPISWKGHKFTLSAGLPFTDVGYLPGVAGLGDFGDRAAQLVTPLIKDPVEFGINYSFFFHDQIQRDNSPNVAAPGFVGSWPAWAKKKFGVKKIIDPKSGKQVWAWPGKADYVAHAVPGLANTALQVFTPGGRAGGGLGGTLVSASGVKATPLDPVKNAMNLAYQRQQEIQKEQAGLRQQPNPANGQRISAKNPTPRYTLLSKQLKIVEQIAYQAKQAQGYKKLPRTGGPPSPRGGSGASGGGYDFSTGGSTSGGYDFSSGASGGGYDFSSGG